MWSITLYNSNLAEFFLLNSRKSIFLQYFNQLTFFNICSRVDIDKLSKSKRNQGKYSKKRNRSNESLSNEADKHFKQADEILSNETSDEALSNVTSDEILNTETLNWRNDEQPWKFLNSTNCLSNWILNYEK